MLVAMGAADTVDTKLMMCESVEFAIQMMRLDQARFEEAQAKIGKLEAENAKLKDQESAKKWLANIIYMDI